MGFSQETPHEHKNRIYTLSVLFPDDFYVFQLSIFVYMPLMDMEISKDGTILS